MNTFRWNISKREQLGKLIDGSIEEIYYPENFMDELLKCCARIISFSDNSEFVFIGRSPESIFDYLSGLLCDTSWHDRCLLFNYSNRDYDVKYLRKFYKGSIFEIRKQLTECNLSPYELIQKKRAVSFVDIVSSGRTFTHFIEIFFDWINEVKCDRKAVLKKIRFIGITIKEKTSPNTWRWHQNLEWTEEFRSGQIKNVSLEGSIAFYLAGVQNKTILSNNPERWGDEIMKQPPRDEGNIEALKFACKLFQCGSTGEHRLRFAHYLAKEPGMKLPWFRKLINELRR